MKAFWSQLRVGALEASTSPQKAASLPGSKSPGATEAPKRPSPPRAPPPMLPNPRLTASTVRVTWGRVEQQLGKARELLLQGSSSPPTRSRVGALLHQAAEGLRTLPPEASEVLSQDDRDALGQRLGRQLDHLVEACPPFGILSQWGSAGTRVIEAMTRLAERLDRCPGLPLCDAGAADALEAGAPRDRAELDAQLAALDGGRALSVSSALRQRLKLTIASSSRPDHFRVEDRLREKKGQLLVEGVHKGLLDPMEALEAVERASPHPLLSAYAEGRWPPPASSREAQILRSFLLRQGLHPLLAPTLIRVGIAEGEGRTDGAWERTVADRIFSRHVAPDRGRAVALPHLEHSGVDNLVKDLALRAGELPLARREALAHVLFERREEAERSAGFAGRADAGFDRVAELYRALRRPQ